MDKFQMKTKITSFNMLLNFMTLPLAVAMEDRPDYANKAFKQTSTPTQMNIDKPEKERLTGSKRKFGELDVDSIVIKSEFGSGKPFLNSQAEECAAKAVNLKKTRIESCIPDYVSEYENYSHIDLIFVATHFEDQAALKALRYRVYLRLIPDEKNSHGFFDSNSRCSAINR